MKKLIFALSLLMCAQFSNAQYNASGYGLNGNVRFVEESIYDYVEKFGEIEIGRMFGRKCMHFYDGGLISKKYVIYGDNNSRDTSEISTYEYVYNEKSQIKELNEYRQNANGYIAQKSLKYKTKYKFDEAGKAIQGIKYNSDGSFHNGYKYVYVNGELTETKAINSDGSEKNEDGYNYQNDEESILDDYFNYDDEDITNKDEIDNVGNWIKRIVFKANKQARGLERRIIYF